MAMTRAKATALLNKTEMGLYDDSRANALRDHSDARLTQLVSRARTARDRARDLEKRQRLASRKTSGSKSGRTGLANARTGEKAELLADILSRLEIRQRDTAKAAKAAAKTKTAQAKLAKAAALKRAPARAAEATAKTTSKAATAKTSKPVRKAATAKKAAASASAAKATKKTATKATRKVSTKAATTAQKTAGKPAAKTVTGRTGATAKSVMPATTAKPAGRTAAKAVKAPAEKTSKTSGRGRRGITPAQALENTRRLLEQHEADAKASKPWETIGNEGAAVDAPGYQSPQARSKALALHEAETRQASINGSVSTRDRRNQGKRDHRND